MKNKLKGFFTIESPLVFATIIIFVILLDLLVGYQLFASLTEVKNIKTQNKFKPITINPKDRIFSVSLDGSNVIWCAGASNPNVRLCNKVYVQSVTQDQPVLLVEKKNYMMQSMPAKMSGQYVCWVEYGQGQGNAEPGWTLYVKKEGKEKKAICSNRGNPQLSLPNFTISDEYVVFDYFIPNGSDSFDSPLYLHSLVTGTTAQLLQLKGFDLMDPYIYNNKIIFCKLYLRFDGSISSRLCLYDIDKKTVQELPVSDSAYQPSMNSSHVLFKEAPSLYNYGKIRLYNLETKKTITLSTNEAGGEKPYLGEQYAVWESPLFDKIEGYNIDHDMKVVFASGNTGKPFLKGDVLVWIAEETPGKPVIKYLNLE